MKFGKRLQSQLEDALPEWKDKYLSYKQLKKRLKLISPPNPFDSEAREPPAHSFPQICDQPPLDQTTILSESQDSSIQDSCCSSGSSSGVVSQCIKLQNGATAELSAEEADFIHFLNEELEKFNIFFMEKEEEYVIRLQELKEKCERIKEKTVGLSDIEVGMTEEMMNIRKAIVNFHGEMVLLENYSSLNYTGLVKILKKHDKRTGALLRMPFIRNVLHQPFFTTELLSKLIEECEMNLQSLFPCSSSTKAHCTTQQSPTLPNSLHTNSSHGEDVDSIYKSTLAALRTIKEIRKGSSTYNAFSLPPFKGEDEDSIPCITIPICTPK